MEWDESILFEDEELVQLQRKLAADPALQVKAREAVIRHSYRMPCEENTVVISIDGKEYDVINIGSRGLGIQVESEDVFDYGQCLKKMALHIEAETFSLDGKIVHVTMEEPGVWLVGISLHHPDTEVEKMLREIIQQQRGQFFGAR